jgi:hypothetical protein
MGEKWPVKFKSRFSRGGLHGKYVVASGKGKTGTIPAFAVGRATWEASTSEQKLLHLDPTQRILTAAGRYAVCDGTWCARVTVSFMTTTAIRDTKP